MLTTAALSIDAIPAARKPDSFSAQLKLIHRRIQQLHPAICWIGVALPETGGVPRKLYSTSGEAGFGLFSEPFVQSSLQDQVAGRKFRVVNNLTPARPNEAHEFLIDPGFQSGLSVPFAVDGQLWGLVVFTAREKHCFTPEIIERMRVYTRVIAQLVSSECHSTENLGSAISAILRLNKVSNSESPEHLRRVAHYSRLIAEQCAATYSLSRQWIEHLFLFAPVHDIGKIFMPEELLTKPGPLSPQEFAQMKTHTLRGREIIDHMIDSFGYADDTHHTSMLRNIITHHHEAIDGSGYPFGLKDEEIPLEARIVAVADVLDALMTKRAYKDAWSVDRSISQLWELAGSRLDAEFVGILASSKEELMEIRTACGTD
ncbi:HD domain-containing phosphohydrolase [Thiolapillus sp.]